MKTPLLSLTELGFSAEEGERKKNPENYVVRKIIKIKVRSPENMH